MFGVMGERTHMFLRRKQFRFRVGDLTIGGSNEVIIQSMCTTKTADVKATVAEIHRLGRSGLPDRSRNSE